MAAHKVHPFAELVPMERVYLHPGQLAASAGPCCVTTILGSCVATCLWDDVAGVGGINHFLLPHDAGRGLPSLRFGTPALARLLESVVELGARVERLRAKLFGGASVLAALRRDTPSLGAQNVELARRFLWEEGIPLVGSDVGGDFGRKLLFHTHDGAASVHRLAGGTHAGA